MQFVKHQKVAASQSDFKAELSVIGVFGIVEDAVTEFMGDLKIDGLTAKREYNAVWVFAKTAIEFIKNIEWNNEYTVKCFISKIANATMDIDVAIENATGEICFYARTELCALDLSTGRIRRVSSVGVDASFTAEDPKYDICFAKFDAEDLPVASKVKIGFTNIDYAVHTNNVEYVKFMLDTYTVNDMKCAPIRKMDIVFANQSYETDELTVHKGQRDGKDVFVITKDGKIIVKSLISRI